MTGIDVIDRAEARAAVHGGAELRLFATPLAWLQAGGEGGCVLDWGAGLPLLRLLGEHVLLHCERGIGERLKTPLRVGGLPRVKESGPVATVRRAA